MEESKNNSKLVYELRELLEYYLKQHPSISLHGLSKRCGVSFSTLRRILNLETWKDPIASTVLGIVACVKKENNIQTLMTLFDSQSAIFNSLHKAYNVVHKGQTCRPELSEILSDRENYIIYKLAANHKGTTKAALTELLGNPVEVKIDELIRQELIYIENNRIHAAQKNFSLPGTLAQRHIPELLRFVNTGSCFVDKTIFRSVSESISKEVYDEIWQIQVDAAKRILNLVNKKESEGDVPFFFVTILDTMEAPTKRSLSDESDD